jgi:hypothetical protein
MRLAPLRSAEGCRDALGVEHDADALQARIDILSRVTAAACSLERPDSHRGVQTRGLCLSVGRLCVTRDDALSFGSTIWFGYHVCSSVEHGLSCLHD